MTPPLLERVLACTTLPSLPAVALEVLELSRDPEVRLADIANTVQNDQALAGKILKTVNSSFYGLTRPCPSIDRALAYLGLSTVKSLVLGFSLVDCFRKTDPGDFDLIAFWRRSVYSAAAARLLAPAAQNVEPDEAFIAALLQDVGVLAMHIALGTDYDAAISPAVDKHERQPALEMNALGFTHMTVGGELALRWRLPAEIIAAIRHHHTPDRAPPEHHSLLRVVSAAGLAAAALAESNDGVKANRFVARVREWFRLDRAEAFELFKKLGEAAHQLGRLFAVNTGAAPDVIGILGKANELMLQHQIEIEREASVLRQSNDMLARQTITDALTGAANRKHFDETLHRFFDHAAASAKPLSLLFIDADRFKKVNDTHGHQAGDVVLVEIAQRLAAVLRTTDLVFRYGGEEFAVLVPRADARLAVALAERLRKRIEERPFDITSAVPGAAHLNVTISIGVAAFVPGASGGGIAARGGIAQPADLIRAADEAVYAAKQMGRNRVVSHADIDPAPAPAHKHANTTPSPAPGAAGDDAAQVLLVEDNYLAATMIAGAIQGAGATVRKCATAEEAVEFLQRESRVDLVLADLNLPGMSALDLIKAIRADQRHATVAVIVLTGSEDPADHRACMTAGANAFISKSRFCDAPERWAAQIMDFWLAPRKAG